MSVRDIILSWIRVAYPREEDATRALQRAQVCDTCEHRVPIAGLADICGVCKCPLRVKVFSPSGCPLQKW